MTLAQKRKEFSASAGRNKVQEVDRKVQNFKITLKGQSLTPEDLVKAEESIILYVQKHKFEAEIASLKSGFKTISKESMLYKLDPVLDDGILRVGDRLNKAALPAESKHPMILSEDMYVSTLILRYIHNQLGHVGRNHMLSRSRQKYWITNTNSAARKVISDCIVCKRNRGKLIEQKMADLSEERVLPEKAPFTKVGIDYFGPIDVNPLTPAVTNMQQTV